MNIWRRFVPWVLVFLVCATSACSLARRYGRYSPVSAAKPGAFREIGDASYYGKECHGGPTASGETFDMYKLTAAHPSLPFGTRVRVTNLANGASVVVRINDRGPFTKGRIIDLSYEAAKRIKMIDAGVARVEVVVTE
jgi:rare lipoprotein A